MKILVVNKFYFYKGGSETAFFNLNQLLRAHGHEIVEFSMHHEKNLPSAFEPYFVKHINYDEQRLVDKLKQGIKLIFSLEAKGKIGQLLRAEKPDIAHLHIFQHQLTPSIMWEIKKHGLPIVHTIHDLKVICPVYTMLSNGVICEKCLSGKFYNCLKNACASYSKVNSLLLTVEAYFHRMLDSYRLIDRFVSPSDFYRRKFIESGIDSSRIIHIPNWLDSNLYHPNYEGDHYFVFLGRLVREKGIVTLLEAMNEVKGLMAYIIGTGPLEPYLLDYIRTHQLESRVKLLGFKTGNELRQLMNRALFTVLPSEWYENGSYALLESMAYGKPIIGSRIGGIPEYIDHEETGLLFEPGDAGELAEKINQLLASRDRVKYLGKNARRKLETEYNRKLHYERMSAVYQSLL